MKPPWGSVMGLVATLTIVGSAAAFWILHFSGQKKGEAPKTAAPASQIKAVKEGELNILTLTPEAEKRLDIKTEKLASKKVEAIRTLGGEVVLPAGRAVMVSAPFAGQLKPGSAKRIVPGQVVKQSDTVFRLLPLLTTEARASLATALVDAEGQVKSAEVQLKAAEIALARAKQAVAENVGTKKALDDAQAAFELAQKTIEAAVARRELLTKTIQGADAGSVTALNIDSPESGVVRTVSVAAGQIVSANTPLFEVVNQQTMWVRVPVYVGELSTIAPDRPATVSVLGAGAAAARVSARPATAPAAASSAGATRDLFYELENKRDAWAPGQRVAVMLPVVGEQESLVIPWAAVVHDVNGAAWVYEQVGPQKYVRRRVQVRNVLDGQAVLASGPAVGTSIVIQGVAELFGKEMGFGK